MSKINVAVECNIEHRASVYALLTSIVANKSVNSEYEIYMLLGNSKKADWSDLLSFAREKVEIVLWEGLLGEIDGIEKVVCLKWNTLVMGDLTQLYETDLEGKAFAAAENLPDRESVIPDGEDAFNDAVLLLDIRANQSGSDYKPVSLFYNYGYEEYVEKQNSSAGGTYKDVKDWVLILRLDVNHSPDKYFDSPLARIWMQYYKSSPLGKVPLKRVAYTETLGEVEREMERAIPVLLEVEDKNTEYTCRWISTLAENLAQERNLDIRLVYNQLSIEHKKQLLEVSGQRVKVVLYNTRKYTMRQNRVCKEVLASLIFTEYEKVLCIDTKLAIEDDISKICDLSMEDYLMRTLRADKETAKKQKTDLYLKGIEGIDTKISLINVQLWIENHINEQVQSLLNDSKYKKYDKQEILNIVCMKQRGFIDSECKMSVCETFFEEISEGKNVKEVLMQIQKLEASNKQLKETNQKLKAENKQLGKEKDQYLYEITEIRKSMTYKIGRALTLIPRKLRGDK